MIDPEIIICSCSSTEHQMVFLRSDNDMVEDENMVYVHIHLVKKRFWYRLKYGLKYIFGYKCRYGAWDELILERKHAGKLSEVVKHLMGNKKSSE